MMVRSILPSLTLQTESLSEPGTLSFVKICATTIPSNSPASLWTPSTSSPSIVNRSANCSADQSKSTYCLSQLRVTFIASKSPGAYKVPRNKKARSENPPRLTGAAVCDRRRFVRRSQSAATKLRQRNLVAFFQRNDCFLPAGGHASLSRPLTARLPTHIQRVHAKNFHFEQFLNS